MMRAPPPRPERAPMPPPSGDAGGCTLKQFLAVCAAGFAAGVLLDWFFL